MAFFSYLSVQVLKVLNSRNTVRELSLEDLYRVLFSAAHVLLAYLNVIRSNEMLSPVVIQWERQQVMCVSSPLYFACTYIHILTNSIYPYHSYWSIHIYMWIEDGARRGHITMHACKYKCNYYFIICKIPLKHCLANHHSMVTILYVCIYYLQSGIHEAIYL